MVHTGYDGYTSVDYSRLTPVLVEAVKEQQALIDGQKMSINNQQIQIDFLLKE
jgi:hypothetical protein